MLGGSQAMQEARFNVKFIPTLHFDFVSQRELSEAMSNPSRFSGLILTSQTAVEACSRALQLGSVPQGWSSLPVFVVGTATAEAVHSQLALKAEGGTCGNAKTLAQTIIEYFQPNRSESKPLLFPCSDLHMETLPSILQEAGLPLCSIVSYQTVPHPDLVKCLKEEEQTILPDEEVWFVFFSPSGVQFVNQLFRSLLERKGAKLAAIGPTTAEAIKKVGLKVAATASTPTPESLLAAMTTK